jgi:hypothetical protein
VIKPPSSKVQTDQDVISSSNPLPAPRALMCCLPFPISGVDEVQGIDQLFDEGVRLHPASNAVSACVRCLRARRE